MRLTDEDVRTIKETIAKYIVNGKIILFGSRVYDDKKGGDIDLLVETTKKVTVQEQLKILTELEMRGITRKVDLLFKTPFTKEQKIFQTALEEGVVL